MQGIRRKMKAHLGRNRSTAASTNQKSPRIVQARTRSKLERTRMGTFRVIVIPQERKKRILGILGYTKGSPGDQGFRFPRSSCTLLRLTNSGLPNQRNDSQPGNRANRLVDRLPSRCEFTTWELTPNFRVNCQNVRQAFDRHYCASMSSHSFSEQTSYFFRSTSVRSIAL